MLKVAMLSGWHVHAKGYAQEIQENPNACVSCIWDEDPIRGAQWAKERRWILSLAWIGFWPVEM